MNTFVNEEVADEVAEAVRAARRWLDEYGTLLPGIIDEKAVEQAEEALSELDKLCE